MTPLRFAREIRNLTQKEVCVRLDVDAGHYSRMESGQARPSPELAEKLSQYFGPPLNEMQLFYPERYENFYRLATNGLVLNKPDSK